MKNLTHYLNEGQTNGNFDIQITINPKKLQDFLSNIPNQKIPKFTKTSSISDYYIGQIGLISGKIHISDKTFFVEGVTDYGTVYIKQDRLLQDYSLSSTDNNLENLVKKLSRENSIPVVKINGKNVGRNVITEITSDWELDFDGDDREYDNLHSRLIPSIDAVSVWISSFVK